MNRITIHIWFWMLVFVGAAASDGNAAVNVAMDQDGRTFTVTAPGVFTFKSAFSIGVQIEGRAQDLNSDAGKVISNAVHLTESTPCGQADVTETTIRFEKEQVDLIFRLSRVPGVTGVVAQAGIRNAGQKPVNLSSVTPVVLEGQLVGKVWDWLVTALDGSVHNVKPVVKLRDIHELSVHEYGGLYRMDGMGFLFGPVGAPIAYMDALIAHSGNGKISFRYVADMSGVSVEPDSIRWGQQVVLLMEPPRSALARWAEWVARTHSACTDKGALSGWTSWNFLGPEVTGNDILAVVTEVLKTQDRLRPEVIQIDYGYQDKGGQKESNDKFPEGLAFYAQRIAATGARPGLLLDFSGITGTPRLADSLCRNALSQSVRKAVENGFTYFRINYMFAGVMPGGKRTSFEICRDDYKTIREAAGTNAYLLHCEWKPNRATVGLVDASRTGSDANRTARSVDGINQSDIQFAIVDALRSYQLNGRWFAVDNDTYYMGTDNQNQSEIAGKWPPVRTWMSMVGLSCGMAITSDPWNREEFRRYLHNVEVMTPPAKERTEVLDLCTSENWPRLAGHVRRAWGDSTVALLWNPLPAETSIWFDFGRAGMDPKRRYAVWSFWDNRFLGVAKGSWTTPAMQPLVSQHLRFTDLDRTPDRPVLIGSSLHIYCGAVEIKNVVSLPGSMEVEMTDAGALEGDLFVYSRWMPFLKTVSGCTVRSVANAGENVWRISIIERKSGVPQRISLGIMLPVTRQAWFWALIAVVAGSMMFAMWRYIVGLRLQRENDLEQERTRIARDLHDDLGSNLTQIAYLGDTLLNRSGLAPDLAGEINKMRSTARDLTRSLDETVWAVDPAQDNLDSLTGYFAGLAQEIFSATDIHCRFDFPDNIPLLPVSADVRHNLFMAFKEALHNVVRHANASEVNIKLVIQPPECTLVVADNGRGFEAETAKGRPGGGHGLGNIRKRLEEIGGKCEVRSRPGAGTEWQFVWRLQL